MMMSLFEYGTDAMRGYRIFNGVLQSKKFDPDEIYIREYVPELATVQEKWIHEPQRMPHDEQGSAGCWIGTDYPVPVVKHSQTRREYLNLGKQQVTR